MQYVGKKIFDVCEDIENARKFKSKFEAEEFLKKHDKALDYRYWKVINIDSESDEDDFYESKKFARKSMKESISDNDLVFKVATTMGEVTNVRIDKEFDYLFDINALCDIIYFVCDELDADYKFHMLPKYDHGTQIRVDFVRDVVKVGWLSFEPLIKDTFELTKQIEGMLK